VPTQLVRDIMTTSVVGVAASATLVEAARDMRVFDIGDVLVMDGDRVVGIVTDRDIVIRALAVDLDPAQTMVGDIATPHPIEVAPGQPAADAVQLMRENALRRLPVCEDGRLVGVLSLGNLATERDPESALADISAAPPDR
jgi:CBS domain-containing protein